MYAQVSVALGLTTNVLRAELPLGGTTKLSEASSCAAPCSQEVVLSRESARTTHNEFKLIPKELRV